jgi:putative ABC transport system permease protein
MPRTTSPGRATGTSPSGRKWPGSCRSRSATPNRGFRVLGTTRDYFEHYRYRREQGLEFRSGGPFEDLFDTVLGADVAEQLGYELGQEIVVAHGLGRTSFAEHADKPFRVAGILEQTGTPVDRTIHVSLEAIEAIHVDWRGGAAIPGQTVSAEEVRGMDLTPRAVTAALIGLRSKLATFDLQRFINEYPEEPITAVLPGVALQELWSIVGTAETALRIVSAMVVATALLGMATAILATLNERRREMAILRSVGATPWHVLGLLLTEAGLLALVATLLGVVLLYTALLIARPLVDAYFGLYLEAGWLSHRELLTLGGIMAAGLAMGFLPAFRAYRLSVADGMIVRT